MINFLKKNILNKITTIEQKGVAFSIFLFSLFPIIPNKIKGLPVVVLIAVTLLFFLREIKFKEHLKYGFLFSLLPVVYLLSLTYTANLAYGFKKIETTASLFFVPICLAIIFQKIKSTASLKSIFIHGYIWATTIYAASIVWYFNYLGLTYCRINLSHCLSYLDGMFFLSEHPIYVSMFMAIGLIFIANNIFKQNNYIKLLYFTFSLILSFVMFLLMRKGIIIGIIASFFGFFILNRKYRKANIIVLITSFCVILVLSFNFKDAIYKRFSELTTQDTYEVINDKNSTSIRYSIYSCSMTLIGQSPVLGYGVGDAADKLVECYTPKSEFLATNRYNSHNQFFAIVLYVGLIGLILLIWQFVNYFKSVFNNNDILYFQVLIFFLFVFLTENILDRQSGVILFSFIVNFLFFHNLNTKEHKITNG